MRIDVTFQNCQTREVSNRTLSLAETFVNDGLGDRYYGPGMTRINVSVLSNAKAGRKLKRVRKYKGSFAEHVLHEVNAEFGRPDELSIEDFGAALALIESSVTDSSDCWRGEFRLDAFHSDFHRLLRLSPRDTGELISFSKAADTLKEQIELKILRSEDQHRLENPRPCVKKFGGMRHYASNRIAELVEPQAAKCCRLFEGLLRAEKWLTPGYQEIYVNLDESPDHARLNRSAIEAWHENAYAVIQHEELETSGDEQKDLLLIEAFCTALRELARIDHLDQEILESVIAQVKRTGFATDLVYLQKENDAYRARILYRISANGRTQDYRLEMAQRSTGKIAVRELDVRPEEELWLAYRFGKLG